MSKLILAVSALALAAISVLAQPGSAQQRRFEISKTDTAVVFIDPQNDVLSETGVNWGAVGASVTENHTVENMERIFKAAKANGYDVFISPHYFYPTDNGWHMNGPLEADEIRTHTFARAGSLSLAGFLNSGADWLARFKPYIEDGKTIVVSPHKVFGPQTNDLVLQLRKRGVNKIILGGMLANMCVESHLRELLEQGSRSGGREGCNGRPAPSRMGRRLSGRDHQLPLPGARPAVDRRDRRRHALRLRRGAGVAVDDRDQRVDFLWRRVPAADEAREARPAAIIENAVLRQRVEARRAHLDEQLIGLDRGQQPHAGNCADARRDLRRRVVRLARQAQPEILLDIGRHLRRGEAHFRPDLAGAAQMIGKCGRRILGEDDYGVGQQPAILGDAEGEDVDTGAPGDFRRRAAETCHGVGKPGPIHVQVEAAGAATRPIAATSSTL